MPNTFFRSGISLSGAGTTSLIGFPSGHLRLRLVPQDGVEVRVIEGDPLPPGLQPAFAWKQGYLVLASTPALKKCLPKTAE